MLHVDETTCLQMLLRSQTGCSGTEGEGLTAFRGHICFDQRLLTYVACICMSTAQPHDHLSTTSMPQHDAPIVLERRLCHVYPLDGLLQVMDSRCVVSCASPCQRAC